MPKVNERAGYPVSAAFDPPFDMLTHLSGSNASGGNVDVVGASLTKWGGWQAGRYEPKAPTSADAGRVVIVQWGWRGSAGRRRGAWVLLARRGGEGIPVIARRNGGDELLEASVAHNGFGELVDVRVVRIGGRGEEYCRAIASAETAARRTLAARGAGAPAREVSTSTTSCWGSVGRGAGAYAGEARRGCGDARGHHLGRRRRRVRARRRGRARRRRAQTTESPSIGSRGTHPRMASSSGGFASRRRAYRTLTRGEHLAQRGLAVPVRDRARGAHLQRRRRARCRTKRRRTPRDGWPRCESDSVTGGSVNRPGGRSDPHHR